jgi:hypothetical protein
VFLSLLKVEGGQGILLRRNQRFSRSRLYGIMLKESGVRSTVNLVEENGLHTCIMSSLGPLVHSRIHGEA